MKTLPPIRATAEQLPIISQNRLGTEVICGAAGSGKTTTALLRLRSLCHMVAARRERQQIEDPLLVLVLTFNRTLAGYVSSLAEQQIDSGLNASLEVETFARWAMNALGNPTVNDRLARRRLHRLATQLGALTPEYVVNEVEYLLGRFEPERVADYVTTERTGRGVTPRVERSLRQQILDEVVSPYLAWLDHEGLLDWNALSVQMSRTVNPLDYDIVIVDESQDFSSNQLRAIRHHLAHEHTVTFVIDTAQRIYARGFTWAEAGFTVRPENSHVLRQNYRNTRQIAAFAAGILDGMRIDGDGALPNLAAAQSDGPLPTVLKGRYSRQAQWSTDYIMRNVDLEAESVAFLKPNGGRWFSEIRHRLEQNGLGYADITRQSEWPEGEENIALSTFYSAKGLEFDYVFIIGLNDENTPFEDLEKEDRLLVLRRLLAVAVTRARKAVVIGYKVGEESKLVEHFLPGTFTEQVL